MLTEKAGVPFGMTQNKLYGIITESGGGGGWVQAS